MQQGGKASVTLFRYDLFRFISLLYNGSARIGLLSVDGVNPIPSVRPFNSEVHSASALLPDSHHHGLKTMPIKLSGNRFEAYSSSSAFLDTIGRYSMTEGGGCQEGESDLGKFFLNPSM
jgi:hypothetical protein